MLNTIREAWGWMGLEPAEVVAANSFGNLIIRATDGAFWRICPEEWSCQKIASNSEDFATVSSANKFRIEWEMSRLVEQAREKLGPLPEGRCYCLKVPAVIGGAYEVTNMGTISLVELTSFAGDMAKQIKDLPDGSKIEIKIAR
ncbi:MAG: T6SS immunity protein Tdi1 domain-containing protein [Gemmataceae bacterium]